MNLDAYPVPVRPIVVIENRIQKSISDANGLLKGVIYDREARIQPLGCDTLPFIQPVDYPYFERIFGGAARDGQHKGNTPLITEGVLSFFVASRREYGMVTRDATDPTDGVGVFQWCDRLKDVIETDEDGNVDAFLSGTVAKPVSFTVRNNYVSDLAYVVLLEVTLFSVPFYRGGRTPEQTS